MASVTLPHALLQSRATGFAPLRFRPAGKARFRPNQKFHFIPQLPYFPSITPISIPKPRNKQFLPGAYGTGPASDPAVSVPDGKFDESVSSSSSVINWGVLWSLLAEHKLRLLASVVALVGCTTCTLSMPIFSGKLSLCFVF